jgi:hypothetical protein
MQSKDDFLDMYDGLKNEISLLRDLLSVFGAIVLEGEFGENLNAGGDIKKIKYDRYNSKVENSFIIIFNDNTEFNLTLGSIEVLYKHLPDVLKVHAYLLKKVDEKIAYQKSMLKIINGKFAPMLFSNLVGKEEET